MWATLKKQYLGAGKALKETYFKEIITIDYLMFNNITAFIVYYKKLYSQLIGINFDLSNDFYTMRFIGALEKAFLV